MKELVKDRNQNPIQAHVTDPGKCLGTKNSGTVFKKGSGGDVDISGWLTLVLYPTADGQVVYNGNATAVEPIYTGQANVLVIHPLITQIVPNVNCVVCGM